jgi:hypothetical protein
MPQRIDIYYQRAFSKRKMSGSKYVSSVTRETFSLQKTMNESVLSLRLENLCACLHVAKCIVANHPVHGTVTIKVKVNRPYRVAFAGTGEYTEFLEQASEQPDPVLYLSEKSDDRLYISEVIGPNQYFEKKFEYNSAAVREGSVYVLTCREQEESAAKIEGVLVVDIDADYRGKTSDEDREPEVGTKRTRGGRPAKQ